MSTTLTHPKQVRVRLACNTCGEPVDLTLAIHTNRRGKPRKRLPPDDQMAKVAKMFLQGVPRATIVRYMNDEIRVPTPGGGYWTDKALRKAVARWAETAFEK